MKRRIAVAGGLVAVVLSAALIITLVLWDTEDSPFRGGARFLESGLRCRVLEAREVRIRDSVGIFWKTETERIGVEYSIILSNGYEPVVVQDVREGDHVFMVGETCRLWTAEDGETRVMPVE